MQTRVSSEAPLARPAPWLKRIAVFRALQLGDLLCALPALRALRAAAPQAHITFVGLPWAHAFCARYPELLDDFIAFPGHPAFPEQTPRIDQWSPFLMQVQSRAFDLAIQLHGNGRISNGLIAQFGARRYAGFAAADAYRPERKTFIPFPPGSELHALLTLMRALGAPDTAADFDFPIGDDDRAELAQFPEWQTLSTQPYICLHPGARGLTRRWHAARFAAVADALAERGLTIVLTGTASEHGLVGAVAAAMHTRAINLCGRTSLGALAALLQGARLLVCNDTGVSHLAAAVKVPSVVVVTGSDPRRWAPENRSRHRIVMHPIACRPCAYAACPYEHACATAVSAERVAAEAQAILDRENHRAA